ncbi:MAG: hypothetical protein Q7J06_11655, partial [Bacteroidales bacterium]|nr:hypothetical protein [Bacteroidales bacterium]
VIDEIIDEPGEGAHSNYGKITESVKSSILSNLEIYKNLSVKELIQSRFEKYSGIGKFSVNK